MDKEIITLLEFIFSFLISGATAFAIWSKTETEKTKRFQIEAQENSLGKEAVVMIKAEISELQKYKGENTIKVKEMESIIKQLEIVSEYIERRMLGIFPEIKR